MGCDIHLYVERRVDEKWRSADKWTPDKHFHDDSEFMQVAYVDQWYNSRNYELFSVLAGVRNEYSIVPIAAPKGVPVDVSPEITSEYGEFFGVHSASWLTLGEILSYDWTQTFIESGYVSAMDFFRWDTWVRANGNRPNSWCKGVGGGKTKIISEDDMRALISNLGPNGIEHKIQNLDASFYCLCEWPTVLAHACSDFWSRVIPRLLRLGDPKDVRIVFWFDN